MPKQNRWALLSVAVILTFLLAACRQTEMPPQLDKDEEHNLVIAQELSNSRVQSIEEDATGQLWIATFRGLNRYDGHEYHQYFCTGDPLGLPDNNVQSLLCDKRGRLWVATVNGVCRYTKMDNFERIPMKSDNLNARKLLMDSKGRVFVYNGTELMMYDEAQQVFVTKLTRKLTNLSWGDCFIDGSDAILIIGPQDMQIYSSDDFKLKNEGGIEDNRCYYFELLSNDLLVASGNGILIIYDVKSHQPIPLSHDMQERLTSHGSVIQAACLLENNSILLSTSHNGLFELNLLTQTLHGEGDAGFSIPAPEAYVTQIFQDSRKNIWFGTYDKGLFADYYYKEKFGGSNSYLNRVIDNSSVFAVAIDQQENLWISTMRKGVFVYHSKTQQAEQIEIEGLPAGEKKNAVTHIFCDRDGLLWLSTTNIVMKCRYEGGRLNILGQWPVPMTMDFEQADDGTVWASSGSSYIFGFRSGAAEPEAKQAFNVDFTFIPSLLKLNDGSMLISAFFQNIMRMNTKTGKMSQLEIPDMQQCIRRSVYIPTDMLQDSDGDVWIGTVSNGLLRYNPKTNSMTRIAGLSCSDVGSIEEDRQGNLWISTMKGLNRLDRKTGRITSLYKADGIGSDEFCDRASCQLPNGCLVFGGTDGITMFNPADIDTLGRQHIIFCDLKIHNQLVKPSKDGPIEAMLDSCTEVRLGHDENSFSISFTALDYGEYERVHYYYMMDGFDNDWTDAVNGHVASYANLPAGHYTFRVRTADNAGNDTGNDERTLSITVAPAPANSWWAWLIYLVLAAVLGAYLYHNAKRVVKARRAARKAQMEKEQEQRTNQMNMSFFANIAHEFRTPLTMIAGPVGQLAKSESLDSADRNLLTIAQRSIQRMFKLVNQLMDFNKLENDTLRLSVEQFDVVKLMNDICDTFEFNAREKGVVLNRYGMEDQLLAWTDGDKLEKILSNLLSNALKFTPSGGKIDVSLDVVGDEVKVCVADTGKGIPDNQLENIFKRYYQLDNQTKAFKNWGTGIGLYYSRRLAELHHGSLTAGNRTEGQGAVFTYVYPMNEEAYTAAERTQLGIDAGADKVYDLVASAESRGEVADAAVTTHPDASEQDANRPTILIVDDDTEIINYMRILFAHDYRLITCLDADTALDEMRAEEPNLVLSDVAMPGKDGYQLCQEIKQDIQLSHIPVILVTAKVTAENQVEGLSVGADAYVTKPFEPKVLSALIQSQLKNRERVRKILTKSTTTDEEDVENVLSEQDKHFMEELYKLMEEELSNAELDVTRITKMLYISRTKLYYKIKGLTGETPGNFFRTYKLNRAAELLKSGKFTIAEITDKTGFSTPSHFSVVFKKHFGVTPSEYKG